MLTRAGASAAVWSCLQNETVYRANVNQFFVGFFSSCRKHERCATAAAWVAGKCVSQVLKRWRRKRNTKLGYVMRVKKKKKKDTTLENGNIIALFSGCSVSSSFLSVDSWPPWDLSGGMTFILEQACSLSLSYVPTHLFSKYTPFFLLCSVLLLFQPDQLSIFFPVQSMVFPFLFRTKQ